MLQNLQLTTQNKMLIISLVVFIILFFILNKKNAENPKVLQKESLQTDTLIPKGQVLVPIELVNIEALAGLIDRYGIIDLYSGFDNNSVLIASRIKILQAPLNPNQYAVLVTESLSQEIMQYQGPFRAVVQNRFIQNIQNEKARSKITPPPDRQKPLAVRLQKSKKLRDQDRFKDPNIEIEYYQENPSEENLTEK